MPITFSCGCGKVLRVPDAHAGKKAKCPGCGSLTSIPMPATEEEAIPEVEPAEEESLPVARTVSPSQRGNDEDDGMEERERPRKKRRRPARAKSANGFFSGFAEQERGWTNAGVVAGMLMMAGAVVWFVGGLMVDILFYYPPVLFVVGLVAFIKGLIK